MHLFQQQCEHLKKTNQSFYPVTQAVFPCSALFSLTNDMLQLVTLTQAINTL